MSADRLTTGERARAGGPCLTCVAVSLLLVGAGGLGQLMDQSMKMLNGGEASTILLTFLLLVVLADAASAVIRKVLG